MNTEPLTNYDNPGSLGSRLRARRMEPLKTLIRRVHATRVSPRITTGRR